jgi:7-carboxy-7-deazaguanine synthase
MTSLRIVEIFDSLQGEGYWTGVPMTFVRLAGCNAPDLGLWCCRWCDTPKSWDPAGGVEIDVLHILDRLWLPRLCLTGGEPLLQVDSAAELVIAAHGRGVRVHLETNGTIDPGPLLGAAVSGFGWSTVSPKPPDYLIAAGWKGLVDEIKLVADAGLDAGTAELLAEAHPGAIICIQPEAGAGAESVERAVALVMSHPEWRLSLQTHKMLGLP